MIGRLLIVAGDPSGDLHGSEVVAELRRRNPGLDIYGIGGDRMKAAGMDLVVNLNDLSFMGFVEVVKHLPLIREVEKKLAGLLDTRTPDLVMLIDYPGFNLRFAKCVKRRNIPVVYYIAPQVWAWGRHRLARIKALIDRMFVIFPFEKELYEKERIPVEFVGHPLLDIMNVRLTREDFFRHEGFDPSGKLLGLIPGSRGQEIHRMLPVMLESARILKDEFNVQIAVSRAPNLGPEIFRPYLNGLDNVRLVDGGTYELMKYSEAAIVTSGTATLETACFETPMVVVYKASAISYLIGRMLVSVDSIGLVNIVAGRKIVPELIQSGANAAAIAGQVRRYFAEPAYSAEVRKNLAGVRSRLGTPGAASRVAERLINFQNA